MPINGITSLGQVGSLGSIGSIDDSEKSSELNGVSSFKNVLQKVIEDTNNLQAESSKMTESLITGKTDNIHQVMIAGEKAEIALQFTMQVRNKIMDAYNEIMRMQI